MGRFLIAGFVLLLSGCASIISDSSYPVTFNSDPPGAAIEITNRKGMVVYSGTSPTTITLKSGAGFFRGESYTVRASLDGAVGSGQLRPGMDGWYFGNLLIGGLIGMLIVDPATGAMYRLPASFDVELAPSAAAADGPQLRILSIAEVSEEMRESLIALE